MQNSNNAVNSCIVLDTVTRTLAKSVSYFELSNYAYVLNDINDIGEAHKDMNIIIFEAVLLTQTSISVLRDLKTTFNLNFILLYSDDEIADIASSVCMLRKCDYRIIDVNLVYSILANDEIVFEAYKNIDHSIFSFSDIIKDMPDKDSQYLRLLYQSLLDCYLQYNLSLYNQSELKSLCSGYEASFERLQHGVSQLQKYYDSLNVRVSEYETRLTADYDRVVTGDYPDRPLILYFKEFQHIQGMDVMLNILYFVLTVQYKHSCKIVKLLDSSNALQARFVPDNYTFIQNTYNNRDILENNFIMKRGTYDLFFDTLLLNRFNLHVLIVHDMRGCTSLAIDENLIHSSICCATSEYKDVFEDVSLLTESKKASKLYWNINEYAKIPVNERLFKLSAHPTIAAILNDLF